MDDEQHAADVIRARARERAADALERADSTLDSPRPFAAAQRESEERAERQREEDERWQRRAAPRAPTPAPAPPPAPTANDEAKQPVPMGVFVKVIQNLIGEERERAAREQQPLLERMARLETRLAQSEGRLAGIESRKAKK